MRRACSRIHAIPWFSPKVLATTGLTRHFDKRASDDGNYPRNDAVLTEIPSTVRVCERSDLHTSEVGDRRSDVPIDVAMEMVTAATCIATDTGGATIF